MARVAVLLLVVAVTGACAVREPRAEAERLVKPPQLGPVRAELPGAVAPTLAAIDGLASLERGPSATDDACTIQGGSSFPFAKPWWDVSCNWKTTRYYGFDGDFGTRTKAVEDALVAAGWSVHEGADLAIGYYRENRGRPQGQYKYDASFLPDARYERFIGSQPWTVRVSWGEAGQVPRELTWAEPKEDYLHHEAVEVDRVRTYLDITSRHQYLLVMSVSARYFTRPLE